VSRILHIFRKDAIRLWPQASVFLALLALNGWADRRYAPFEPPRPLSFLPFLLPIACSVLLVALVHEEGLVGDGKYWLSRPIPRRQLLGAKILFALVFINVPLGLYQAAIIVAAGLPLSQNWINLLCLQLFFTAVDILPVTALAAVTKNMVQTILVALTTVALIVAASSFDWSNNVNAAPDISWISSTIASAILALVAFAVLTLQYFRRATTLARLILTSAIPAVVLAAALPYAVQWAIQMRLSPQQVEPSAVRISWLPEGGRVPRRSGDWAANPDFSEVEIPIRIDNLPPGASLNIEAIQPIAKAPSGAAWRPGWTRAEIHETPSATFARIYVDSKFLQRVKDTPIHLYGVMDLTLLLTVQPLPLPVARPVPVPGIGNCFMYPNRPGAQPRTVFSCNSTLPAARIVVVVNGVEQNSSGSAVAPYPSSPGYSPLAFVIWNSLINGQALPMNTQPIELRLEVQKPIAYIQRPFDFQNIRLSDYAFEPPNRLKQ